MSKPSRRGECADAEELGGSAEKLASKRDIGADLLLESVRGRKLQFAAQFLDEGDFEILTIEVATKVEDMNFDEATGGGMLERRAEADVDNRGAMSDAAGINTVGRKDFVVEVEVGSGETETASAMVAGFDGAEQRKRSAEHGGSAVEAPVENVLANGGRADGLAVGGGHGGDFGHGVT
jgi:hypothetical protein